MAPKPVMLFDKFGAEAVNALMYAQQETRRIGSKQVGADHLFLGVVHNPDNAKRALTTAKIKLADAQKIVADMNNAEPAKGWLTDSKLEELFRREEEPLPFASDSKQILRVALAEAESYGSEEVRSEHLLLAMLREVKGSGEEAGKKSGAILALERMGIDVLALKVAVETDAKKTARAPKEFASVGGTSGGSTAATLESCGQDLTFLASEGKLDMCVGREAQIDRMIQILVRRRKSNPCLVGDPGVGKTAIAEGLALKIVEGKVPPRLRNKRLHSLELSALLAGTKYRGEFEDRLRSILEEVQQDGNNILFIDELHTLIGAGAAEGAIDAANILKPALARSGLQCVGATTLDEYRKYVEKDAALERRFQPVMVMEPSVAETIEILEGLRPKYEEHHEVTYGPETVENAATMASRYINDRYMPDKAIDLLDEAGAIAHVRSSGLSKPADSKIVTQEDVAKAASIWTGIPVGKLNKTESLALLDLEVRLHESIVGQNSAVRAVARAVRRARTGMRGSKRPVASFLFAGPTGVGKTYLAKTLASNYYGTSDAMIRFDMSEFAEQYTISRFLGSPPGYVGFDDGGQLTNAVRRRPHSLLLFDEIEKAHPDLWNVMLGLLEDGQVQDAKGRRVDFTNTIVIYTTNVGSDSILEEENPEARRALVGKALGEKFRPEFLNRLDEIVVFDALEPTDLDAILKLNLNEVEQRATEEFRRSIQLGPSLKNAILDAANDRRFGARPIRRAVQRFIEDPIAESALNSKIDFADKNDELQLLTLNYDSDKEEVICAEKKKQAWRVKVDMSPTGIEEIRGDTLPPPSAPEETSSSGVPKKSRAAPK